MLHCQLISFSSFYFYIKKPPGETSALQTEPEKGQAYRPKEDRQNRDKPPLELKPVSFIPNPN